MAYNFASTGDDLRITHIDSLGNSNTRWLLAGWFYPTTLTAGRHYWGAGTTTGVRIAATTSEIEIITINTTDGVAITSGAGIVTDVWQFIAIFMQCSNTGPILETRVWVGTLDTPPVEIPTSLSTSPAGNFSGAGNLNVGNAGNTTSLGFQGDVGWQIALGNSPPGNHGPTTVGSTVAMAQAETDHIFRTHVIPIWRGDHEMSNYNVGSGSGTGMSIATLWPCDTSPQDCIAPMSGTPTLNNMSSFGPTFVQTRAPRPHQPGWPMVGSYVRR